MNLKKINLTNILLIILILILLYFISSNKELNLNISQNENNTITISGKAEKYIVPDTARITFSVNEYKKSQKEAADIVNKKTKKIIEAIEDLGIDKKYIKTRNYSLHPQYNWNNGKRSFQNYRASQSIEVLIKDLDKTSKVLAKAVELKVDNISGPNMFIDKLDEIKEELRAKAINDAKSKAKKLASELGVSLDKIVGFSENNNSYYPQPFYRKYDMVAAASAEENITEPEITPGEDKINKSVSITFKISN